MTPGVRVAHARKMKSHAHYLLSLVVCSILSIGLSSAARAQQVWFSPGDDLEVGGVITHPDFPMLFDEPSPWPTGLAHINVLQIRAHPKLDSCAMEIIISCLR